MKNAMTVYDQFDQLQRAAIALKESGYFADVKSKAQAIVKVMAGAELGLPPFASMTGIHIIKGKPVLGANVLATLVKNDPRYDYRIKSATSGVCELTWFEDKQLVGTSSFSMAEAKVAGLNGKDNWKHYPSDMLFARAISRGARRYAPGIFGGSPVYTPDEMGADVDEEGNVVVDSVAVDVTEELANPEPPREESEILDELGFELKSITEPAKMDLDTAQAVENGNGKNTEEIYQAVVDAKLSENIYAAKNALAKCKTGYETSEKAIAWMTSYRGFRDMGGTVAQAAKQANAGEVPK